MSAPPGNSGFDARMRGIIPRPGAIRDGRSAQRPALVDAQQPHPALRDQLLLLVADPHLPQLAHPTAGDRARAGVAPARADRAYERPAVLDAAHPLAPRLA